MCCVMGFCSGLYTAEQIRPHFDLTKSRGPDDTRIETIGGGLLCFHRLSIMGLDERGMQPFSRGQNKVVCNGELYGWRAQRKGLEAKGYSFASDSDCELLLPLYEEYGLHMFTQLDAEFALILYDGEQDRLIAARDPIGIRPLYYGYFEDGSIAFASEAQNLVGLCEQVRPFPPGHYYDGQNFVHYADLTTVTDYCGDDLETVCKGIRDRLIAGVENAWTRTRRSAFFSPAGWIPVWSARSLPGSWGKRSEPLPLAWIRIPST